LRGKERTMAHVVAPIRSMKDQASEHLLAFIWAKIAGQVVFDTEA
jgi:hypothetical protein